LHTLTHTLMHIHTLSLSRTHTRTGVSSHVDVVIHVRRFVCGFVHVMMIAFIITLCEIM